MRKFTYLCAMMLLSMDILAQIDPYDRNWDTIVFDDFNQPRRQFDSTFRLYDSTLMRYDTTWIAFCPALYPSGVTKRDRHQIFQWNHCVIDPSEGILHLNSEYIRDTPILCDEQPDYYYLPPILFNKHFSCSPKDTTLYYYSGMIESQPVVEPNSKTQTLKGIFRYGFFEIRCRLPIHQGALSAFWLWDADSISPTHQYYEEIDIFEFSWSFEDSTNIHGNPHPHGAGNPYCFTTGLYYNDASKYQTKESSVARNFPMIGDSLSHWHTFAFEWLPERVVWYCDGNVVNEYHNPDSIPSHRLTLKTTYEIDRYALAENENTGIPVWDGSDSMAIDYIKVSQLDWDCDTDETITSQQDLEELDYGVKRSIGINPFDTSVKVKNTDKVTFRVTESFEISGTFQVDAGGEMTVILQQCPEEYYREMEP